MIISTLKRLANSSETRLVSYSPLWIIIKIYAKFFDCLASTWANFSQCWQCFAIEHTFIQQKDRLSIIFFVNKITKLIVEWGSYLASQ